VSRLSLISGGSYACFAEAEIVCAPIVVVVEFTAAIVQGREENFLVEKFFAAASAAFECAMGEQQTAESGGRYPVVFGFPRGRRVACAEGSQVGKLDAVMREGEAVWRHDEITDWRLPVAD
jgi:hypothetical protein